MPSPFVRRSAENPSYITVDDDPGPRHTRPPVETLESFGVDPGATPALRWTVQVVRIPVEVPVTSAVTFRDDTVGRVKVTDDLARVDMATTLTALAQPVWVFNGPQIPEFTIDISPAAPRVGAEHRSKRLGASDFRLVEPGLMSATVPWSEMAILSSSVPIPDPRPVETRPVVAAPAPTNGMVTPVLVVAGAALAYAVYKLWPRPRSNPSCCTSCERGGPCRKKRHSR